MLVYQLGTEIENMIIQFTFYDSYGHKTLCHYIGNKTITEFLGLGFF